VRVERSCPPEMLTESMREAVECAVIRASRQATADTPGSPCPNILPVMTSLETKAVVTAPAAILASLRTRRLSLRTTVLPLAATAFFVAGGVCWLLPLFGGRAASRADANTIWFVGLVLTGLPVIARELSEVVHGHLATDLIATLAICGAVGLNEPLAGLVIVVMQTGGEALEKYAEGRASAAVRELEAAAPRIAHRMHNDRAEDIPADLVAIGDVLVIRPGELVPCDAIVISGHSALDVSRLTGEPMPVDVSRGSAIQSGSGNGEGELTVRATAIARESQYNQIVELVRSAEASKAPFQRVAERYAIWFTPITLIVSAGAWLLSGDPKRALAVLVVATPCPLILATPIGIIGGINRAARARVIVRNGGALEQIGTTTAVVVDKTGTLTIGRPAVASVLTHGMWSEHELLRLAGAVEQGSAHLLARTLVEAAQAAAAKAGASLPRATRIRESPGRGVTGLVDGHEVTVGARTFISEKHPGADADMSALESRFVDGAGLRAFVSIDGAVAGVIEYADRIRDDARTVVQDLHALGIQRILLLSGDHETNVRQIASELGITDARADLRPQDKAAVIRQLQDEGERVLMIGDGINDAPAMSAATVGVALSAHGGGITAEAAGIVVLADELSRVPQAIRISRRTMRIVRRSLSIGLGLSGAAMVLAATGLIAAPAGALLQEVIDIIAILNALQAARA
jgi:heavy metal translocating P-type ATPase